MRVIPRDTRTGQVLEQMILPALEKGGYAYEVQVNFGRRLGGGRHRVDVVARDEEEEFPISLKWQQVSGTAEQKVPYEIICLAHAVAESRGRFRKAYLVLGGGGWKLRECFVEGELRDYLTNVDAVQVVTLENFIAKANNGQL